MTDPVLALFSDVSVSTVAAADLRKGACRLDASFYDPRSLSAERVVIGSGLRVERLRESTDIFCSTQRGRTFVSTKKGVTLLGGHNLDTDDENDVKSVSRLMTRNIVKEQLVKGDVLISSAGTVGLYDFVWRNHEGKLASQHIIRIRAKEGRVQPGYLYAYLSSPLALSMITNQSAGSVIVTLYTSNLAELSVPRPSARLENLIHENIVQSFSCRSEYRELLQESRSSAASVNALAPLPDAPEEEPECLRVPLGVAAADEYRLDAHFYNAAAQLATSNIRKCRNEVITVGDVTERVFFCNRFTRTFVDRDHGIPYLAGKDIVQIRPPDLAYLSRSQTSDLDAYRLVTGWILMTCSGTVGRACLVWKNFEEFVGTHDLVRIVPDASKIDGGYLYAFLSSEYGKQQVLRYRHGSVIDHVTPEQVQRVLIPLPSRKDQTAIGDKVRAAYEKRAEAIRLEEEAQAILMKELTKAPGSEGA
jgi:type I restriction enzyme S subunit